MESCFVVELVLLSLLFIHEIRQDDFFELQLRQESCEQANMLQIALICYVPDPIACQKTHRGNIKQEKQKWL